MWKEHGPNPTSSPSITRAQQAIPWLSESIELKLSYRLLLLVCYRPKTCQTFKHVTCAWVVKPAGASNEGKSASGTPSPGHIHIISSCSIQGNACILTFTSFVDGIFSQVPSVEYSQPFWERIKVSTFHKCYFVRGVAIQKVVSYHGKDTGFYPPLQLQDAEDMLCVHRNSEHNPPSHLNHGIAPMVLRNIQMEPTSSRSLDHVSKDKKVTHIPTHKYICYA